MPQPSTAPRNFTANASSLLAGQLWRKGCMFLIAVLMAQTMGSVALGRFLSAISFVWLFWMVADAGLSELFIRDVSSRQDLLQPYAAGLLKLRCWLAAGALTLIGTVAAIFPALRSEWPLILVMGLVLAAETFTTLFLAVFRVQERMQTETLLWSLDGLLHLGVVAWVAWTWSGGDAVLAIGAGWLVVSAMIAWLAARAVAPWWPVGRPSGGAVAWLTLVKRGWPLALASGLSLVTLRGMVVLVDVLRGHADAGLFGAGERLLEALLIIPLTLGQVLLPMSARLAAESGASLRRLVTRALAGSLACGLLFGVALAFGGGILVRLTYGQGFESAAALMPLLGWVVAPLFLKPVVEKLLFGCGQQAAVWRCHLGSVAVGLVAAWLLVPSQGLRGAAVSLLAAEASGVAALSLVLWRSVGASGAPVLRDAWLMPATVAAQEST